MTAIIALLSIVLFFQTLLLRKSQKDIKSISLLTEQYSESLKSSFQLDYDARLYPLLAEYFDDSVDLVVCIPNSVCWACLMSLLVRLDEYGLPKHNIKIVLFSDFSEIQKVLRSRNYINIEIREDSIFSDVSNLILLKKLNEWTITKLQYEEGMDLVLDLFMCQSSLEFH